MTLPDGKYKVKHWDEWVEAELRTIPDVEEKMWYTVSENELIFPDEIGEEI